MKLRNKKTGEIATLDSEHTASLADFGGKLLLETQEKEFSYATLAELNEEWEDYEPKEPLIKDEKIRKAVRAWAIAAGIKTDEIKISKGTFFTHVIGWLDGLVGGVEIGFRTSDVFDGINDGAEVTLAELCGEGEE